MEDKRNILEQEQPFSYKKVKGDKALIYWYGKQVMIVSGKKYQRLLEIESSADPLKIQLFLAKTTGHFKHGNERKS